MLKQNIPKTAGNRWTKPTEYSNFSLAQRVFWKISIFSIVILKDPFWSSSGLTR